MPVRGHATSLILVMDICEMIMYQNCRPKASDVRLDPVDAKFWAKQICF